MLAVCEGHRVLLEKTLRRFVLSLKQVKTTCFPTMIPPVPQLVDVEQDRWKMIDSVHVERKETIQCGIVV